MDYNLQDPWDLKQLEVDFSSISTEEWQSFIDYTSQGENWKKFKKTFLYIGFNNAGNTYRVSPKQMLNALLVAEKIKKEMETNEKNERLEKNIEDDQLNQTVSHFTLRVAWHDNAWNGKLCKDPEGNRYCSGFHSLLSDRIRRNKEKDIDKEKKYADMEISKIDYLPPCFWSINLNGTKSANISHINPAEKALIPIQEELSSNAMISWPFGISFVRSLKQQSIEGSYPPTLDNVRVPVFRDKIKKKQSIAIMYANYSNPFTEEERQYLVIGAALIMDKGESLKFGPIDIIEAKRKKDYPTNKYFPVINWALQFKLDEESKVMMPYHEYLERANSIQDAKSKQELLDKIKVAVSEPELVHCFKYVAMDVDDDDTIYILSKMRQKLIDCQTDGIIDIVEIKNRINKLNYLINHCWKQRGYFPGIQKLANILTSRETKFNEIIDKIIELRIEDIDEKIIELLNEPKSDVNFKLYKNDLLDLKEMLDALEISIEQFLTLSMLNLTSYQFQRILDGKIWDYDSFNHTVPFKNKTPLEDVCKNPYLLVEEYLPEEGKRDENTGEVLDKPIELYKVDIGYFPDGSILPKLDLQRSIKINDKRRLRCLIINYLHTLEQKGDCFEEASILEAELKKYPLFYNMGTELALATDVFKKQVAERDAFFQDNDKLKIVDANDSRYYYLNEIYDAEKYISDGVLELIAQPKNSNIYNNLDGHIYASVKLLSKNPSFQKDDFSAERTQLYQNIFSERLFILAGGPGSGKSHELLNIIREFKDQGESYLLLTPTGKAALRLKSDEIFKDIEASTIDKWLSEVEHGRFTKEKLNRINNLIIDETSMVDLMKFLEIFKLIDFSRPSFKRLIFVGDPNQLPAIGYGKVLKDILFYLKSNPKFSKNYIELTGNHRSTLAKNKVIELSQVFEEKGEPDESIEKILNLKKGDQDISEGFKIVFWKDEKELQDKIIKEFELLCKSEGLVGTRQELLHQLLGLKKDGTILKNENIKLENFQILSPYLSGLSGSDGINDFVQKHFKSDLELSLAKGLFKESDKIIRTKNYYDNEELLLSNGSIGLIQNERRESLYFQENLYKEMKLRSIRKNEQEFFELAYAISIHKSQGSGFDNLFIIVPDRLGLLSRELIYTALTRCKKSVTLFLQNNPDNPKNKSLLELARTRTFVDARKTTLLIDRPYRHYGLEPEDGVFVQSHIELDIYKELMERRDASGLPAFDFKYEIYPTLSDGTEIKIKTDFTIYYNGKTWYWEHLGRLGNRVYDRNWHKLKRPTYSTNKLESQLITTDQLNGIKGDKIKKIIADIINDSVTTEDITNKYSLNHYSLR
jgi:exodeoxyribonuclease V alpha subunit